MSEEEIVDIEQELSDLLTKVQPNLQDVIKRVNKRYYCAVQYFISTIILTLHC